MNGLSGNYYYMRDGRSKVKPPIDLIEEKKRKLAAIAAEAAKAKEAEEAAKNASSSAAKPAPKPAPKPEASPKTCKQGQPTENKSKESKKLPTPGQIHKWD